MIVGCSACIAIVERNYPLVPGIESVYIVAATSPAQRDASTPHIFLKKIKIIRGRFLCEIYLSFVLDLEGIMKFLQIAAEVS